MNRRNFFKNLGAATVGVIIGRTVIAGIVEKAPKPKREGYMNVDWDKVREESIGIRISEFKESELILSEETRRKLYARYGNAPTIWDGYRSIGRSGL